MKSKKPKVCDACLENYPLHWSEEEEMWICDECEEALYEKRSVDDYWYQESINHMDEDY